jgi:hypothetical protein
MNTGVSRDPRILRMLWHVTPAIPPMQMLTMDVKCTARGFFDELWDEVDIQDEGFPG